MQAISAGTVCGHSMKVEAGRELAGAQAPDRARTNEIKRNRAASGAETERYDMLANVF
jgi:hypothetical protein